MPTKTANQTCRWLFPPLLLAASCLMEGDSVEAAGRGLGAPHLHPSPGQHLIGTVKSPHTRHRGGQAAPKGENKPVLPVLLAAPCSCRVAEGELMAGRVGWSGWALLEGRWNGPARTGSLWPCWGFCWHRSWSAQAAAPSCCSFCCHSHNRRVKLPGEAGRRN